MTLVFDLYLVQKSARNPMFGAFVSEVLQRAVANEIIFVVSDKSHPATVPIVFGGQTINPRHVRRWSEPHREWFLSETAHDAARSVIYQNFLASLAPDGVVMCSSQEEANRAEYHPVSLGLLETSIPLIALALGEQTVPAPIYRACDCVVICPPSEGGEDIDPDQETDNKIIRAASQDMSQLFAECQRRGGGTQGPSHGPGTALERCISDLAGLPRREGNIEALARALSMTFPRITAKPRLFVDVSELAVRDRATGCQRAARSILLQWLQNPPADFEIVPVYASKKVLGYKTANTYVAQLLGGAPTQPDEVIDYAPGDVFLGLDFQPNVIVAQRPYLDEMRMFGVSVRFVVYDLLPLSFPSSFSGPYVDVFEDWLKVVCRYDGIIAISHATAAAFSQWASDAYDGFRDIVGFDVSVAHLGADIENSAATTGLPATAERILKVLDDKPTFLVVSTLEPRKSHATILSAFERLWEQGAAINLVFVGRLGWKVEQLAQRLWDHAEKDHRLFWLEGISDEYLREVYARASCLINASLGEGFGLPLIEAAREGVALLVRDIPVFREIAGPYARYFTGTEPEDLAGAVEGWLEAAAKGETISSQRLPYLDWATSAEQVLEQVRGV